MNIPVALGAMRRHACCSEEISMDDASDAKILFLNALVKVVLNSPPLPVAESLISLPQL